MKQSNIAVGLDIGTTKVCIVVARRNETNNKAEVIGVGVAPTRGLRKGVVIDVEETVTSISEAMEKAERMSGVKIDHAVISIGGNHLESLSNKGAVAVSNKEGDITASDVSRTLESASAISLQPNREVIHVIPQTYTVDDQEGIKDPVGMSGIRLEANTYIIHASAPFVRNLERCINQAGIQVDLLVAVPIAAATAVLSKRQKELGSAVIDMGGETTSIAVYEEGNIIGTSVIPIGSNHITKDITVGLRTSPDVAERIKLEYGAASRKSVGKKDEIDLSSFSKIEKAKIKRQDVVYLIEARLTETFSLIKKEMAKIKKGSYLPGGIVLTGGGAKMPEVVDFAKKELKLPTQIGFPHDISGIVDRVDDPSFAVPLGLVFTSFDQVDSGSNLFGFGNFQAGKVWDKAKKLFKNILP